LREGRIIKALKLKNGDPFAHTFAPPAALRVAFQKATLEFVIGGQGTVELRDVIAPENALSSLRAALQTVYEALRADELIWGEETIYKERWDGLPLRLGDAFMELVERIEDDDAVPPMTKLSTGDWLTYRDHLAALAILQLDRAATAIAAGDADLVAWLLCDHYNLGMQIAWEDSNADLHAVSEASNQAARKHGRLGGALRHERTNALKAWALGEASSMKDADMEVARSLAQRIPSSLLSASRDPERLIYEALRKRRALGSS
jgi:hypothetical protein